jgi:alkanesulfonate monooxygenase SsuD/methylene tetrahydromethanopterin reductase-like flavin-dependent oxidoreductase (luciferase family)
MLLAFFTEMPMAAYPEKEALRLHPDDHPARRIGDTALIFSNKYYDSMAGSELYRNYLEQYRLAEEVGYDAVMTNEHHYAPFCMQTRCNITTSFIAAQTERVWLLQLGNPLPLWDNPVQLAEEIAMIDMMSGGRLISGIVRGGGNEQLAMNVNPAYNRERMAEAHDLIIKAWTVRGPWRWEGVHYQHRVVNPWALPLQKPHPRIFMPGVVSKETIVFAAEHGYPFVCLNTTIPDTKAIFDLYAKVAEQSGYQAGPEHRGYLLRCHVAETDEKAYEHARHLFWMAGEFTGLSKPIWNAPTGYTGYETRKAAQARQKIFRGEALGGEPGPDFLCGTPDTFLRKLRVWMEETRPGTLIFWTNDGRLTQEDSLKCIRMMGTDILPAVREMGKELGLVSPMEVDAPVSLAAANGVHAVPAPASV